MSVKYKIYRKIRDDIIYGRVRGGERLTEIRLSQMFNCSRGPIREALMRLGREGFVDIVPHKGALVSGTSRDDLKDYYNLLALLESQAVTWSIPNLNFSDIEKLLEVNTTLKACADREGESGWECWHDGNQEFHRMFWGKCGNEKLAGMIEEIRRRIFRYRHTSLKVASFDVYRADHEAIIAAVRDSDAARAEQLMQRHIMRAYQVLDDFLKTLPG